MKLFFRARRFRRLNLPGALLIALLQRTPVLRIAAQTGDMLADSPVGSVLRSVLAAAASLGAVHSLVGATPLVVSGGGDVNGVTVTTGTNVQIAYTVSGTQTAPASWRIQGTVPPGLSFSGLTGAGVVNVSQLTLTGTPTTPGTYNVTINAFEGQNATLISSPDYPYVITVNGNQINTAPTITTQPQSFTLDAGSTVTFNVGATGTPAPTYQWQKGGTDIPGATNSSLTLTNIQSSDQGTYDVVVTNVAGAATSSNAALTVKTVVSGAPTITLQPSSITVATGSTGVFNVVAAGATSYQWQLNGANIATGTGATLVINNASLANAGSYTVVTANTTGSSISSPATLTVKTVAPSDAGRIANLSVRTFSGSGAQVLSVGFVIGGAGTAGSKPVLVRVIGPFLGNVGVSGTMADPTLTIQPLGSSTVVASNDDWGGDPTVTSVVPTVGAFPLPDPTSKDSALVTSLSGGAYTAVAAGKNNSTGIVLTELYDATPSTSITATTPRLVNVSARAQVGTGDGILVAGFNISGTTAKTLLIRAIGPTLGALGVPGTLSDPVLNVDTQSGTVLYTNDNWGGSSAVTTVGGSVGAFGLSDPNSKDSALVVSLPPGTYTANVTGVNNLTGVALVEIYEVP